MLRRLLKFATNNPLVSGLLLALITFICGTLYATRHWSESFSEMGRWWSSDAHVTHGTVVVLCVFLAAAGVVIVTALIWLLLFARGVARGFKPSLEQKVVMHVLMEHFPAPLELGRLRNLIAPDKTPAHAAEEIDGLIRARVVREVPDILDGGQWYALTDAGRKFAVRVSAAADSREAQKGQPEETRNVGAKVAEGFEPNRVQLIAAKVLIDRYPKRLQLPDLASAMQQLAGGAIPMPVAPQGEIARQMENMERHGVAVIADPDSQMAYYGLTRHGRDFMLEKWQATARRPQTAGDPRSPFGRI